MLNAQEPSAVPAKNRPCPQVVVCRSPRVRQILIEVAEGHRLRVTDILGRERSVKYTLPRHLAMYRIRHELGLSLTQIGAIFGRDHTTILHCVRRHMEISARS